MQHIVRTSKTSVKRVRKMRKMQAEYGKRTMTAKQRSVQRRNARRNKVVV